MTRLRQAASAKSTSSQGLRRRRERGKRSNGANGASDIEGKVAREAAGERGQRPSFNQDFRSQFPSGLHRRMVERNLPSRVETACDRVDRVTLHGIWSCQSQKWILPPPHRLTFATCVSSLSDAANHFLYFFGAAARLRFRRAHHPDRRRDELAVSHESGNRRRLRLFLLQT